MGRVLLCAALATGFVAAQTPSTQAPVFRGGAESVPVFVTVTDKSGRLVPGLTRDDFQIFDNGRLQPITVFDNSAQPIRLIILIDVSGSMAGNAALVRAAAGQLIANLRADDLVRVGTFGHEITISPRFTRDEGDLARALPPFIPPNAPTPLWQAVDQAMGEFGDGGASERERASHASGAGPGAPASARVGGAGGAKPPGQGRRVILIMSDGKDTGPLIRGWRGTRWLTPIEIVDRAGAEDVMVYAIAVESRGPMPGGSLRDQMVMRIPDPGLGRVAEETGGGYYELRPRDDLGAAFARIADELHQQYLLGFAPSSRDGRTHKIEIKLASNNLKARARRAYRAPK